MFLRFFLAILAITAVFPAPAVAQEEIAKLTASDGAVDDEFGIDSCMDGDLIVVGASGYWAGSSIPGAIYVFRYAGCSNLYHEEAKITASDGAVGDQFGSCAVSGDVILAGAFLHDGPAVDSGAAYIYRYDGTGWVEEAELFPSDIEAEDHLGLIVSIEGNVALISSTGDDDFGLDSGAAYVFRYDGANWKEEAKLFASDAAAGDAFGFPVALSGDRAVIGAYDNDDAGPNSGSAYVFHYDGTNWIETAKLTASDAAPYDRFGMWVSIDGDVVMVGAPWSDGATTDTGAAYVFRYDGASWKEEAKLTASDGETDDEFGEDSSIAGNLAVITSWKDDDGGTDAGAAYVFHYDGTNWIETAKLTASDIAAGDGFGNSAWIEGDMVQISARWDDDNGTNSGSIYVFGDLSGSGLSMMGPFPGEAASLNRFDSLCGTPGAKAFFVWSLYPGTWTAPNYPDIVLSMAYPRVAGTLTTGFDGIATLYANIPAAAQGVTFYLQTAEPPSSVSNLVVHTFM